MSRKKHLQGLKPTEDERKLQIIMASTEKSRPFCVGLKDKNNRSDRLNTCHSYFAFEPFYLSLEKAELQQCTAQLMDDGGYAYG